MKAPLDRPEIYTWNSWVILIVHREKCVQVVRVDGAIALGSCETANCTNDATLVPGYGKTALEDTCPKRFLTSTDAFGASLFNIAGAGAT